MKTVALLAALVATSMTMTGCDDPGPASGVDGGDLDASDDGGTVFSGAQCGSWCGPLVAGEPLPAGFPPDACYDGCNWCVCDEDGTPSCTARACADAGP